MKIVGSASGHLSLHIYRHYFINKSCTVHIGYMMGETILLYFSLTKLIVHDT